MKDYQKYRKFVCVLKSGGDYKVEDVRILSNQVRKYFTQPIEFICLTDIDFDLYGVIRKPLILNQKGKWSMQEVFRIKGTVVAAGLDTVFVDNCDKLFDFAKQLQPKEFGMINSFSSKRTYANGLMCWNGDVSDLMGFDLHSAQKKYVLEQMFTIWKLNQLGYSIKSINEIMPVYSYKYHIKEITKLPVDCRVILFHGKPRPSDCNDKRIKQLRQ